MQIAVLDACILFRGKLTDFLLCLAEQEVFDPIWSDAIHDEWTRNLHARHCIPLEKLGYRRSEMERAFPAANCQADPHVLSDITAQCRNESERKDAHVVATAVAARATVIVTDNLPDFPTAILDRYGLAKMKPDKFSQEQFHGHSSLVIAAARTHRESMTRPPYSQGAYLDLLGGPKLGLPGLAGLLFPHKNVL